MRKQTRSEGEAMSAVLRTHELATTRPQRPSEIYHKQRTDPSSLPTVADRVLIMVFLSAITLPLFGLVMRLDTGLTLDENRVLASMPAVNLKRATLAKFPAKFERYFNDRFGFRQRLIQWLNFVKVAGLGVSPSPRVVLGQDHWLFYGDIEVPYYRALNAVNKPGTRTMAACL